jgi:hypothetical protein
MLTHRPAQRASAALIALLVTACANEPIEWNTTRTVAFAIRPPTRLVIEGKGLPRFVRDYVPRIALGSGGCAASIVGATAAGGERYAAWFVERANGSVALVVARSSDAGATWSAPVVADDRDRGTRGCVRPAPSIAADSGNDYIHVAYYIEPREGAGVWYTHSMERGAIWHQTIGILYGEEPVRTSVASDGDTVLVAYEHPGSGGRRIGLAVSRQAGHTFDERLRVVHATGTVRDPRVAVSGGFVALAWSQAGAGPDSTVRSTRLRMGRLR